MLFQQLNLSDLAVFFDSVYIDVFVCLVVNLFLGSWCILWQMPVADHFHLASQKLTWCPFSTHTHYT